MKVIDIKKIRGSSFRIQPVAAVIAISMASLLPANLVHANAAFGVNTDISGATINVPTYFAATSQGIQPAFDPATHAYSTQGVTVDTGMPLRKFVDPLAGAYNGLDGLPGTVGLQSGMPVGIPEKWKNPLTGVQTNDDYYEIAVVDFTEQMHSDLPKQTRLRGYVQIETPNLVAIANGGAVGLKDITGLIGSEHIPATYPDGTPIYKWKLDPNSGVWSQSSEQVYWVHQPHYLGPVIVASKGGPVRIKFTNYLPYWDANGIPVGHSNGGDTFIPVDETIAGGGSVLEGCSATTWTPCVQLRPESSVTTSRAG